MSKRRNTDILRDYDRRKQLLSSLKPAPPQSKRQECQVCRRVFYSASLVCPDWENHRVIFTPTPGGSHPIPGDTTDERNYLGGWTGAGRAIVKGLRPAEDRWKAPKGPSRSLRAAIANAERQAEASHEAQALAWREALYAGIAWPRAATDLQRQAYYLTVVQELSLSRAGGQMGGITKRMVKRHADKAKEYATLP